MTGKITVESEKATTSADSCMQLLFLTSFVKTNIPEYLILALHIILLNVLAKIRGLKSNIFTRNGFFRLFQWTL